MAIPLCPYFGNCGGCSAQHIDYSIQLENKRKLVQNIVKNVPVQAFGGDEYHYRNRMDLIFHPQGLGFRRKNKWYSIIDIEQCAIANETINKLIKEVRAYFAHSDFFDIRRQTGTFKQAVIRAPAGNSSISFVLNEASSRIGEAIEQIKDFSKKTVAENIAVTYVQPQTEVSISENYFMVKGTDFLTETLCSRTFQYSIQGFFQNNSAMAQKMLEYTKSLLKKYDTSQAFLIDLYGGVGVFGIVNAENFKSVAIVENYKASIEAANMNIKTNNISNAKGFVLDAKNIVKLQLGKPLFVIADPPRTGMDIKVIQKLSELKPEAIIYVSCNPQQLAKEIPKFKSYSVKSGAVFDLFPQTPHIESVIELARN